MKYLAPYELSLLQHETSEDLGKLQNLENLGQFVPCHSVLTNSCISSVLALLFSCGSTTQCLHTKLMAQEEDFFL